MESKIMRTLEGKDTEIYVYDGKMRLVLICGFSNLPAEIKQELPEILPQQSMQAIIYPDNSAIVYKASLVDFDTDDKAFDDMLAGFIDEMEGLFGLQYGERRGLSCWVAGFSCTGFDWLMSSEEQQLVSRQPACVSVREM